MTASDSQKVQAGIQAQGGSYKFTFHDQRVGGYQQPRTGTSSLFSSYGPTEEGSLKPSFSTPGGWILSTWPIFDGLGGEGYALLSGTSMATPHAAGCVALLRSQYPDLKPAEIMSIMQSSARPLPLYGADSLLNTAAQQGSGLLNCAAAYKAGRNIGLSVSEFNLRNGAPQPQKITIQNKGNITKAFRFSHKAAATADRLPYWPSINLDFYYPGWNPAEFLYDSAAGVQFQSDSVTIPAGGRPQLP